MGRTSDPNSNGSSFSILLGQAKHLDMGYTIFGVVLSGFEALDAMQQVETTKQGIFVMPVERITILSTYVYDVEAPPEGGQASEAGGGDAKVEAGGGEAQTQLVDTEAVEKLGKPEGLKS